MCTVYYFKVIASAPKCLLFYLHAMKRAFYVVIFLQYHSCAVPLSPLSIMTNVQTNKALQTATVTDWQVSTVMAIN